MQVLGVIVAREGSKSIPKKSIAPCAGNPLLFYTAKAAQRSKRITRLIISTDGPEIAEVARSLGVEVPFLRPKNLGGDDTPDLPVFQHVLEWLDENEGYQTDVVVHLRPTTPLKKTADIDEAVRILLENPDAESVRSICEPYHTPFKMYRLRDNSPYLQPILQEEYRDFYAINAEPYNMPRQKLPVIWRHSGYVDAIRPHVIRAGSMSGKKILPLYFDRWRDVDIDSPRDLAYAELILKEFGTRVENVWE